MKFTPFLLAICAVAVASVPASAQGVVYSNIPGSLQGNYPSLGYEATATSELGNLLHLTSGGSLTSVSVVMSDWARQSDYIGAGFTNPLGYYLTQTLNVYNVGAGNTVGSLIGSVTQSQLQQWRPEADPNCQNGGWGQNCYSGYAYRNTFDFSSSGIVVPADAIFSLYYDTGNYGHNPLGAGPWNSLNFALGPSATTVGSNPLDTMYDDAYWLNTPGFQEDAGLWGVNGDDNAPFYAPMFEVETTPEPASLALIATGLLGVGGVARRRRAAK